MDPCAHLSGCSVPDPRLHRVLDDVVDQTANLDRLTHADEIAQERLDGFRAARRATRRDVLKVASALTLGTVASPLLGGRDAGAWPLRPSTSAPSAVFPTGQQGRVHVLPSLRETVSVGAYDPAMPPALTIDSGDVVTYTNTWNHWGDGMKLGDDAQAVAALRGQFPIGPHSNVGPVIVRGAVPGDVIEARILRLRPIAWGYTLVLPGAGSLPNDFTQPNIRYFEFDDARTAAEFLPGIKLPVEPFQGILGVQPEGDQPFPSSPPGPYGGNMDLRELVEGTSLFVPVFHPGARLWTSDSHAVQGDGEVTITAIETAMEEAQIQYVLHKNVPLQWPMVETPTHWIGLGSDADLDEAMTICLRNMIGWLSRTSGMSTVDAYSLCSLAASFRVTQNVNRTKGIHAMLPKDLFAPELRQRISIVARPGA